MTVPWTSGVGRTSVSHSSSSYALLCWLLFLSHAKWMTRVIHQVTLDFALNALHGFPHIHRLRAQVSKESNNYEGWEVSNC